MSRVEELNRILRALLSGTPEIEAAAIVSDDGLAVASALPPQTEESRVAGLSALLLSLGTLVARELGREGLEQVLIRGTKEKCIVMVNASPGTFLIALTTQEAKLGVVSLDLKRAVAEVTKVL